MQDVQADRMVLVAIDEDDRSLRVIAEMLSGDDRLSVFTTANPDEALTLVLSKRPRIVVLSLTLSRTNAMDLFEKISKHDPGIDTILLTTDYSSDAAIEAIQRGACDYICKPVRPNELQDRVFGLVAAAQTRRHTLHLDRELAQAFRFEGMVGRSPLMLDVYAKITRIARHFRTVLISGATGTGKELAARALHARSPVRERPFVAVNCAAIVDTLVESELFGHVKGAFTGALQDRAGVFEHADGGTVFLDEIGDMSLGAQATLLRIIQNQEIQRVGSAAIRKVNVRIIAATNRPLRGLIGEKKFREDLYYRLAAVEIRLPTLAERKEDLPIVQRVFVERFSAQFGKSIHGITRRAQAILNAYPWPGNVRELENVLAHGCMITDSPFVDVGDLPDYLRDARPAIAPGVPRSLEEVNRSYVRHVLKHAGGNKIKAAALLGISRAKLYRLLSGTDAKNEKPEALDDHLDLRPPVDDWYQ